MVGSQPDLAGFQTAVIQHFQHHTVHPLRFLQNCGEIFFPFLLSNAGLQSLGVAVDNGKRGFQFVGDIGNQLAAVFLSILGEFQRCLQLLIIIDQLPPVLLLPFQDRFQGMGFLPVGKMPDGRISGHSVNKHFQGVRDVALDGPQDQPQGHRHQSKGYQIGGNHSKGGILHGPAANRQGIQTNLRIIVNFAGEDHDTV